MIGPIRSSRPCILPAVHRAWGASAAALPLLLGASLRAQGPPGSRTEPRPVPTYLLAPSPVINMRYFAPALALSGYLSGRATHRNDSTGFAVNRARLTVQVGPKPFFGVKLQGDLSGAITGRLRSDSTVPGFTLTDAYVQLVPPPRLTTPGTVLAAFRPALVVGQFKVPFSLEYLTAYATLKTPNRSQAVDQLSLKRDVGVMGQVGWSRLVTLAAALTDGRGPNAPATVDQSLLVLSRITLTPVPVLEVSGKIADQGADHLWGYDARLLWQRLTLEGEGIYRRRPTGTTSTLDAGSGYALVAYRILPWLEPVYKYDRYWDTRTTGAGAAATRSSSSSTWHVVGVNLVSQPEWIRLQLDWTRRDERPGAGRTNEYIAQLIASF